MHKERLQLAKEVLKTLCLQYSRLGHAYLGFNIEGNTPDFKPDAVLGMEFLETALKYGLKQFALFEELLDREHDRSFAILDTLEREVMDLFGLYLAKAQYYSGKHIVNAFKEKLTEMPPGYTPNADEKARVDMYEAELFKIRDLNKAVQSCIDGLNFLATTTSLPNAPHKFNEFVLSVIGRYALAGQNLLDEKEKSALTVVADRKGSVPGISSFT